MVGSKLMRRCLLGGAILLATSQSRVMAQTSVDEKPGQIVTAYTAPAEQHHPKQNFRQPGIVSKVLAKEGDRVTRGQLLIQLDDSVERHQWESLNLQGNSVAQIEAAVAEEKEKAAEVKRLEELRAQGAGSVVELEEARLARDLAAKKITVAEEDKKAKGFEALAKKAVMDQMQVKSEIDGYVEKIDTQPGELIDPQKPVITLVNNDVLRVEMNLPNSVADKLQVGEAMEVRYSEKDPWQQAAVDFISPTSDASSFTRRVTLALPNPTGISSGHEIKVKLPERAIVADAAK
jgi:RND family efflux transporter MFP subunit